jgi:gas vesicle protein
LEQETDIMSTSGSSGFVMGLVCGGVIGAALGMLFAPRAGAMTRRALARSADGARLRARKFYDQAVETVSDAVDTGAKAFDKAASVAANAAE